MALVIGLSSRSRAHAESYPRVLRSNIEVEFNDNDVYKRRALYSLVVEIAAPEWLHDAQDRSSEFRRASID